MPGIAGVFHKDDKVDIGSLLDKMCASIKHEDWYQRDSYVRSPIAMGRVHLGILNPETQPIFNEGKSLCIMMEGEIYDYQDLKKELMGKRHRFTVNNDPEFILHLYEEYSEDFGDKLKILNGIFAIVIYDSVQRKLIICSDRYGFRPLFYARTPQKFLFSSEMKAILENEAFNRNVDDAAVSDFFSFGHLLGDKTFFKDIKLVPAASILTCDADHRISIKQYWNPLDYSEDDGHPEDYYSDKFSHLLSQAVERCMTGPLSKGLLLSGGLDSRAILACIDKKHYPIHTFTLGIRNCDDVRYARMVAEKLGTNHHFYEIGPECLIESAKEATWLTDGMFDCFNSHGVSTSGDRKKYCDVIITGMEAIFTIWCTIDEMDELAEEYYQTRDEEALFRLMFDPLPPAGKLFHEAYFPRIKECPRESFNEVRIPSNSRLSDGSPFVRLNFYDLTQRQRRFTINGPNSARSQVEPRMPLLDRDVMDFVLTLPPKFRADDKIIYKGVFKRSRDVARVPCQNTGLPIDTRESIQKAYRYYRYGKSRVNGLLRKIGLPPLFRKRGGFADYGNWVRYDPRLRQYILDIVLSDRAMGRGYFNPSYVKKITNDHISGEGNNTQIIGLLLTFELFNRMFVDGERL